METKTFKNMNVADSIHRGTVYEKAHIKKKTIRAADKQYK